MKKALIFTFLVVQILFSNFVIASASDIPFLPSAPPPLPQNNSNNQGNGIIRLSSSDLTIYQPPKLNIIKIHA